MSTGFLFIVWPSVLARPAVCVTNQVVGGIGGIELGELLCDSLEGAAEATLLRFAITSDEVSTLRGLADTGVKQCVVSASA